MNITFRIIILNVGILSSLIIINLLIKKRLSERISLLWLAGSFLISILSIEPKILDCFSKIVGVDYPPSLLFFIATLVVLFVCFLHSMQISTLNEQIRELTQQLVLRDFEHNNKEVFEIKYKEADASNHTGIVEEN
jgi:hypothetical protein